MTPHVNDAFFYRIENLARAGRSDTRSDSGKPPDFLSVIAELERGTFRRNSSPERDEIEAFERTQPPSGKDPNHTARFPVEMLTRAARSLMLQSTTGAFLGETERGPYMEALQPFVPALGKVTSIKAGAAHGVQVPVGNTVVDTNWIGPEGGTITEATPLMSSVSSTVRELCSYLRYSRLLALQTGDAPGLLANEMLRAQAISVWRALLSGTGIGVQPTGVLSSPIGTGVGTTASYTTINSAPAAVANANGVRDASALAWVMCPDVATLLKGRFKNGTGSQSIYTGTVPAGDIDGAPAYATKLMPAATALFGDWSSACVVEYPTGLMIEVDPFTGFSSAIRALRLTSYLDVIVTHPASFYSITAIT